MIKSVSLLSIAVLFFSGCGATIDSIEAYTPIPLEKSSFMPSKEELKSNKTKVILTRIDDNDFKLGKRANLGQSLLVELERMLGRSGTVEILDRDISKKFEHEIRLSEMNAHSQMSDLELSAAKYAISGNLSNAQFSSQFIQTKRWTDKEGKVHVIPAHYNYTASVNGVLKIYVIPSMKIVKTIGFSGTSSRSEDSSFYGNEYLPSDVTGMLNKAGRSAIYSTRYEFKNFLAPKGYIMQQRDDDDTSILLVNIGRADGLETGNDVEVFSTQSSINPLTDEEETHTVKVADGIISNQLTPHRAWIIVKDKTNKVKIGDYIKAKYSWGFGDFFNGLIEH